MRCFNWRLSLLSFAAGIVLAASSTAAQQATTFTLTGVVVDSATGAPISGAWVEIFGRNIVAITDPSGAFRLPKVPAGVMAIRVRQLGYADAFIAYDVASDITSIRINLAPNPIVLEAVQVVTNRFERRRRAAPFSVRALTSEHLAATAAFDAYDFLHDRLHFITCPRASGGQGLVIAVQRDVCIRYRGGWIAPQLYVDGAPWIGGIEALRGWSKADLHRVEIVRGGAEVWIFTRAFATRLAQGQAQLPPFILVR